MSMTFLKNLGLSFHWRKIIPASQELNVEMTGEIHGDFYGNILMPINNNNRTTENQKFNVINDSNYDSDINEILTTDF